MVRNVREGRFECSLSALTAAGALVTAAEIFFEHDSASFGNKMMWWPIVVVPTVVPAGIAAAAKAYSVSPTPEFTMPQKFDVVGEVYGALGTNSVKIPTNEKLGPNAAEQILEIVEKKLAAWVAAGNAATLFDAAAATAQSVTFRVGPPPPAPVWTMSPFFSKIMPTSFKSRSSTRRGELPRTTRAARSTTPG